MEKLRENDFDRPVGVSGLMRAKDDEEFIALSIDSCIEALDELIIVYQRSHDKTELIIREKALQYPNKIRYFLYPHEVLSHRLDDSTFEWVQQQPPNSDILLSSYYNFAVEKAKFKYGIKIDADQIYFKDKLKHICDLYRSKVKESISISETLAFYILYLWSTLSSIFPLLAKISQPCKKLIYLYNRYVEKSCRNAKKTMNFIGINLLEIKGASYVPLGRHEDDLFPPLNGVYDHLLFKFSESTFFSPCAYKSPQQKYGNCVIERFNLDSKLFKYRYFVSPNLLQGGFLWFHMAPSKSSHIKDKCIEYDNRKEELKNISCSKSLFNCFTDPQFRRHIFWYKCFVKTFFMSQNLASELRDIKNILGAKEQRVKRNN